MSTFQKILAGTACVAALLSAPAYATEADPAASYTVEQVTFSSNGETLVGNLYVPKNANSDAPKEAVVVTGAWTSIKEQMPATYAEALAEKGYIALAFDFRTWGDSSGQSTSMESPELKISDIEAAGDFLSTRADVSDVNGLGICASAGYMATAAERNDVFQSIALVAPWLHDSTIVEAVYGGSEGVNDLITIGRDAAAKEAKTNEPQLIPAAGPEGSDALMAMESYYTDPERGLLPEWENTFNLASWEGWLTFDGIRSAPGIEQPVLIVHSEAAAIPQGAQTFYTQLTAEKSELWLDDVSQFDFYDEPTAVATAAKAAADHFASN